MDNKILLSALEYASFGWSIFPCSDKKIPLTTNGFYAATKDTEEIKKLFSKHKDCTIGVATGKASGFFVLDIDTKNGGIGRESLALLEEEYGKLPNTVEAITWSGGRHIYFKYPDDGIGCRNGIRKNIDIKGDGGYVILPPSVVNDKEYIWEVSSMPQDISIAEAPEWLLKIAKENISPVELPEEGKKIPEGNRNDTLMRIGIKLRNTGLSFEVVNEVLQKTNISCCEPPLAEKEVKKISQSVARYQSDFICTDENIITLIHRDPNSMVFKKGNYEFLITNIVYGKAGKLKNTLTLSKDKKFLYKTEINLSIHSHREKFIRAADDETLNQTLVELESLIRKQLKKEEEELIIKLKQPYIITDEEQDSAHKFMQETPDLLYKIIDATNRMGVVGEEVLRLMVYLCFTSRILKNPLSLTVKGESSSGKSFICQAVMKLIPEEGCHFITKATEQAFFHLPEDGLQHKIVYINEMQGSEKADYSIRTAQSEGDLILMIPIKDQNTGNIETVTKKVKGPCGFLITTTKANMFDENETRNFSVFSDDSPTLTKNIGEVTIKTAMGEEFSLNEKEINIWRNLQRLLKPDLKVIIPYAKEVFGSFPNNPVRIRRDRERFREFINVVTILHQAHRKFEKNKIYSTLADYQIAKIIVEEVLLKTIFESSPQADLLLTAIKQMEENFMPMNNKPDFTFTYKELAEFLQWNKKKVKKWMGALVQNNLVEYMNEGGHGKGMPAILRINRDKEVKEIRFLPEINDLIDKYPCPKEYFYCPITGEKGVKR